MKSAFVQFLENPAYIQLLAKTEPVIVNNGDGKQVLVNYDEFMQAKSKLSTYDIYMQIMSDVSKA